VPITQTVPEPLRSYSVRIPISVAWGEMDAFQHVNNTVFFRYFETARLAYFAEVQALKIMEATGVGPILAETSCRFRRPLTFPDTVIAGARVALSSMTEDSYVMEYLLWSESQATVAASGTGTVVSYDYRASQRAPIPKTMRKAILTLESSGEKGGSLRD